MAALRSEAATARLLLVVLSLCWGLSWPAMRIALDEISPWTLRVLGFGIGTICLFALAAMQGKPLRVAGGPRAALHVAVAGFFNVVLFGLFSTFGQLNASTSRVVIVCYSMPVWASLLALIVLRERITTQTMLGLALCVAGLAVLVAPVIAVDSMLGLWLGLGCALTWAAGTVYMKWAGVKGDLLVIAAWQVAFGAAVMLVVAPLMQGAPVLQSLTPATWFAILYSGVIGTGIAYAIWFHVIDRLPTATAAIGSLANPVVGVLGSIVILGERLTLTDAIGFAMVFAAAACVLLGPRPTPARDV